MDMLSALMSPVSKEDELKALADSLRKRKQAADFYSLSTIKPLQAMGQRAGEEVMETGQRQGVLREALARRQQEEEQKRLDREFRQAEREEDRNWRTAESAQDRASREQIAQMLADNRQEIAALRGTGEIKPSANEVKTYIGGKHLAGEIDNLDAMFANMDEEQKQQLDQPWAEIGITALDMVAPEGVARNLREKSVYTDPTVRSYLAGGNRLTQSLSNLAAGLTVTGYEMKARDTWSPFAVGISQEERQIRLDNVKRDLLDKARMQAEMFPQLKALDTMDTSVFATEEPKPEDEEEGWSIELVE